MGFGGPSPKLCSEYKTVRLVSWTRIFRSLVVNIEHQSEAEGKTKGKNAYLERKTGEILAVLDVPQQTFFRKRTQMKSSNFESKCVNS